MTTFTIPGHDILYGPPDNDGPAVSFANTNFTIVTSDTNTSFTYTYNAPSDDEITIVSSDNGSTVNSAGTAVPLSGSFETEIINLFWGSGNITTILGFFINVGGQNRDFVLVLGGTPFPVINTLADYLAFEASITGESSVLSGPFAPGATISYAGIPGATSTGSDTITGTVGDDDLSGTAGDDIINPLSNDGFDQVQGSTGNDRIIYSNNGDGYQQVNYDGLSAAITATINGATNTATVDKGANGTDTIVDIAVPLRAGHFSSNGGFGIRGTNFNDTYNITSSNETWMQLIGSAGNDAINITRDGGTVRLDYRSSGTLISGVNVNLATGVVSNDGQGSVDIVTITGDGTQGLIEVHGSDLADTIVGSAGNDSFILREGNDTVDGGAGQDRVRYDRNNVNDGVSVDLVAGTATGIWNGNAFTHSLTSIESVRGSRIGGDTISGNSSDNVLDGRGGNDTLSGLAGDDTLYGGDGNDILTGGAGSDSVDGGAGTDTFILDDAVADVRVVESNGVYSFHANGQVDVVQNVENFQFADGTLTTSQLTLVDPVVLTGTNGTDNLVGDIGNDSLDGGVGNDVLDGGFGNDSLDGGDGNDRLLGGVGDDSLFGGDGTDTLNAGVGDDFIFGGDSSSDLRDVIFGGDGDDSIDGGYGNDLIFGQGGNDTIAGGFGSDTLQGQDGNDIITGSALSDLVFGNAGDDFVNGGFGHDRINGGTGADRFFHLGIRDHGSDWVQDYNSGEGDVLLFGQAGATRNQFQVNFNDAVAPGGERAGDDGVQEAFVIYRPTGQIMWALIDGAGQSEINLRLGSDVFDLLT